MERAASVAAHVLPKSNRSWEAVTVAVVVSTWVVTVRWGKPCAPGFRAPDVVETVWF